MKSKIPMMAVLISISILFCYCSDNSDIELQVSETEKKVDVMIDGQLFTSYIYPDNIKKPVLWPVMSAGGNMLTRSFPMKKKEGDYTDHPSNIGYPTYWHARGYGLFAANPLGQKIFSDGENELNLSIKKGESVTFKYRLVVASVNMTDARINELADDYAKF